jgi:hypothetical protein
MQSVTSNAVSKANSYSESETFTGRYWTNGKKIYRKVYNLTSTIANMSTNLSSITNAETVITLRGVAIMRDFIMPIPWGDSNYSTTWCGYINMSPNSKRPYLYIMTSGNNSYSFNVIVIVEYTKTTD